ncbi:MAG: hypothetical protein COV67_12820 [Nitrospinae bacterium CG11_big_fil_rev_8_21_14_0_20_56_8]|nr:MAG: hypothetical protein COV67_12820 [Nitrospinae bacterium CG11_big_fil_rev_8_21_14_0_20_56_8]
MGHLAKKILPLVIFFWATLFPAFASQPDPKETVEQLLAAIKQIQKAGRASPEIRNRNQKYSGEALTKLDIRMISEQSLGKYWPQRSEMERKQFVDLLSELFVYVAFPNSGHFFGDLMIRYGKVQREANQALVPVTVVHPDEGEIGIDFHLLDHGAGWKVVDVDLDQVSMRNNLRTQFYKVLSKEGYPDLIRRMTEKLDKARG